MKKDIYMDAWIFVGLAMVLAFLLHLGAAHGHSAWEEHMSTGHSPALRFIGFPDGGAR